MRRSILLVVLLVAIMGLTAQASWSQQPAQAGSNTVIVTTTKTYIADPAYLAFYRDHEGYINSETGHDGLQRDYFRKGNFDQVAHVAGGKIRANRCGNLVDTIDCVVNVTINIPPCASPTPGKQGPQGLQGNTGPQGIQGIPGQQGLQGIPGIQGAPGTNGMNGAPGINGRDGYLLVQQIPRYGQSGPPFRGYQTYQSMTFVEQPRDGFVDYLGKGIAGFISNQGIRPAYSNIQLNNSSASSATQRQGQNASSNQTQGQNQGQGQQQGQQQGQDTNVGVDVNNQNNNSNDTNVNNTNDNNNVNGNTNINANDNDANANASNSNDIGIVNDNAAAANGG